MVKQAVWLAISEGEKEGLTTVSPGVDSCFRIAKQMDHTHKNIGNMAFVCHYAGELWLTDEDKMKAWVEN